MKPLLIASTAFLFLSAFGPKKKSKLNLPEEFVRIPAGTWHDSKWGGTYDTWKLVSTSGFYMSKYEVTNLQYRQFYNEVGLVLSDEERKKIMCDSSGWKNKPMEASYFSQPAYNNFPVVNISYEGASKYCEWLQQKIQKDNPGFVVEVKLPTRQEWTWAAMGGRSQAMFPWGKYYLLNKKGEPMCNFKRISDGDVYRNRITGKPEVAERAAEDSQTSYYTATVKSFYPNDYGLYNMCGNAAEMISEKGIAMGGSWNDYGGDVQIRAEAKYESAAPTIGFRPIIMIKEKE
ncbi:MAG: SUMF1/EgtB/PvdO family nonheme iron enzyme [Sphingobacteriales bacterium]|nr:SUMF1/EgtB/PvdO family nonheme iron enzyme [Sphingobacteriales bacterium]